MGAHLIDGEFQSDKYPSTPRGFVPLKVSDPAAQPHLWRYAQGHVRKDMEFSADLMEALRLKGYKPAEPTELRTFEGTMMPFDTNVGWYVQGAVNARRNDPGVLNGSVLFQWAIGKKVRVTIEVIE